MKLTVYNLSLISVIVTLISGTVVSTSQPAAAGCGFLGQLKCPPKPIQPAPYEPGRPEIYKSNGTTYCHVQNPSQLRIYGLTPMASPDFRAKMASAGSKFVGACSWPDGLYKRSSNPAIYYLYNGLSACWVRSFEKLDQLGGNGKVTVVDDTSDLIRGRKYSERC